MFRLLLILYLKEICFQVEGTATNEINGYSVSMMLEVNNIRTVLHTLLRSIIKMIFFYTSSQTNIMNCALKHNYPHECIERYNVSMICLTNERSVQSYSLELFILFETFLYSQWCSTFTRYISFKWKYFGIPEIVLFPIFVPVGNEPYTVQL